MCNNEGGFDYKEEGIDHILNYFAEFISKIYFPSYEEQVERRHLPLTKN
jgi:hypothetical protein